MISNAQKALLHAAKTAVGLDDEAYRDLLRAEAGVRSSNDLDNRALTRVMRRLEALGFVNTARKPRRYQPASPATPDQKAKLLELATLAGWVDDAGDPSPARVAALANKVCRTNFSEEAWTSALARPSRLSDLPSRAQASKAIEALKAIARRRDGDAVLF